MLTAVTTRLRRALTSVFTKPTFASLGVRSTLGALLLVLVPIGAAAGGDQPRSPANVSLTAASPTAISIAWNASRPRANRSIAGYELSVDGTIVGTTTSRSYEFKSLSCATVYNLGVAAFDDAGLRSARVTVSGSTTACPAAEPVQTASASAPAPTLSEQTSAAALPAAQSLTFATVADARVYEAYPSSNYGGSSYLRVDGGSDPDVESFVRFNVSELSGPVASAKLRIYATSSGARPALYLTSNDWLERGISWATRPARQTAARSEGGSAASGSWIEWDVTGLVTGNGSFSFVLATSSTDGVNMGSRESGNAPRLVVSTGSASGDTSPPTAPSGVTVAAVDAVTAAVKWSAASDDVGVAGYAVYRDDQKLGTTAGTNYSAGGLSCGRTYRFEVEAYDSAGNLSPRAGASFSSAACPTEQPVGCTRYAAPTGSDSAAGTVASPYATAQKLASSLASGETGCLRAGRYTGSYVLDISRSGLTIRSYPGEQATLVGTVQVRDAVTKTTLSNLSFEGVGGSNTLKVYGDDTILEDSSLTNFGRGDSCLMLGSSSGGIAHRPIIRRNRFHDCGDPYDQYGHGIYASQVTDGRITNNVFWNSYGYAIQLYPNSQRTVVARNVIDGGGVSFRGGITFGGDDVSASNENVIEYNVITFAATYGVKAQRVTGSGNVTRKNCFWSNVLGDTSSGVSGSENITADPGFADRSAHDYRLSAASSCSTLIAFDSVEVLAP